MSLPTSILPRFQSEWADRLANSGTSCVVKTSSGPPVFDPDTGQYTPGFTTLYDGPCLVRPAAAGEAEFGEARVSTFDYTVFIPHAVEGIEPEQLVDVGSTLDPDLDGRQFVINHVSRDSYVTVRKLACTEAPA